MCGLGRLFFPRSRTHVPVPRSLGIGAASCGNFPICRTRERTVGEGGDAARLGPCSSVRPAAATLRRPYGTRGMPAAIAAAAVACCPPCLPAGLPAPLHRRAYAGHPRWTRSAPPYSFSLLSSVFLFVVSSSPRFRLYFFVSLSPSLCPSAHYFVPAPMQVESGSQPSILA